MTNTIQNRAEQWSANIAAAMAQAAPAANDEILEKCSKNAEWGWRLIDLPPGITIVWADEELKVTARHERSTSFTRAFRFSEDGQVKDAVYSVTAGQSLGVSNESVVEADGTARYSPSDERIHYHYGLTPESVHEHIDKIAYFIKDGCLEPVDGIEFYITDPHAIREDGDLLIAETNVRYWVANRSGQGREFPLVPEIGVHRVTVDKQSMELLSSECTSRDGSVVIANLDQDSYNLMHPATRLPFAAQAAEVSPGLKM